MQLGSGTTIIMKIVISFEETGLLIQAVSQKTVIKVKQQYSGFF